MSQYLDGVSSTASQHGPKQISLPLQADGNYHATLIRRNYIAAPASAYEPIIGQRTAYTSLLRYSDDFSQANWVKVNTTAAVTSTINDPEGGVTASKLAEDTTNGAHNASQVCTCAAGATAFGVFVKAAERTFVRLRLYNATDGSLGNAVLNLSTGVLVSGTGTIKKLLYGWYWCAIAQTAAVTNSTLFVDIGSDATTWSYAGTTGSGVYLWRATAYLAASIGPAIATTATTPTAVTAPPIDADDPTAFLVSEQELSGGTLEIGIGTWSRQYANIPKQVIVPCSVAINKPSLDRYGTLLGAVYVYLTGAKIETGVGYAYSTGLFAASRVFNQVAPESLVNSNPTAGTFTLTYKNSVTGSLAYNVSDADAATALNALADSITDGITWTVTNALSVNSSIAITASVGVPTAYVSMDASGMTTTAAAVAFNDRSSYTSQACQMAVKVVKVGHGITTSDILAVRLSPSTKCHIFPYLGGVYWSIVDADNLAINRVMMLNTISFFGKFLSDYVPGGNTIIGQYVSDFYLPGFSPGIASKDDIVIPTAAINDQALLDLVVSGTTGYQTYSISGLSKWLGPILVLGQVQINTGGL